MKTKRKEIDRKRIEKACMTTDKMLGHARDVLMEMELEHQRGEDWVELDTMNAWGVKLLKKMGAIHLIKIDGTHRGQINGAIPAPK